MSSTSVAVMALLSLVAVIFIALGRKVNCGILGVAFAFLLGFFVMTQTTGGIEVTASSPFMKGKPLLSGFNLSLFFNIMGVSILFGVARVNGTLELATKKLVFLTGGRRRLIPIALWLAGFIMAAAGAGTIPVLIILLPICASISLQEKLNYTLTGMLAIMGTFAGGLSPVSATGIIGINVSATAGVEVGRSLFLRFVLADVIVSIVIYLVHRGWRIERSLSRSDDTGGFDTIQKVTLGVIIAFAVAAVGFGYDIPSCAFLGAAFLLIIHAADEKAVLASVPWGTLVLLAGMGIVVNMISMAGGIRFLTDVLSGFLNSAIAAPVLCFSAGLMSTVSSGSGVVMPTLIPTAPVLAQAAGVSPLLLIVSITLGAHLAAVSPLSTGGAIMLSMAGENMDTEKIFKEEFMWAIGALFTGCILAFFGILG